ncbi:bile acid:sodium symporter family protein [Collinsella intestinalis]|nr:bile acid:sodium symporter family protein [Collinsella intestinalis]
MEAWKRLGGFIGANMPVIVVGCVATGVLFPRELAWLEPLVPAHFAFMTFQGSLGNTLGQLGEVLRHPAPLLAILGVTLVAMPALAFLLSSAIFAGNTDIVTGILIEYSVPIGIVSFMWVGMFSGNTALGLTAILVSTLVSPITIPLTLKLLMGASIDVDAPAMMFDMTLMIAAPALVGMIVNDLTRGWGRDVLSPVAAPLSKIFLVLIITSNSTAMSEYVLHMTWMRLGVALFILLFTLSGFAWGALMARVLRVNASTAVTMSFDCGLRNISSGAVIATRYFPGEVVFPVMCGTLFQQLLASLVGRTMTRAVERGNALQRQEGRSDEGRG